MSRSPAGFFPAESFWTEGYVHDMQCRVSKPRLKADWHTVSSILITSEWSSALYNLTVTCVYIAFGIERLSLQACHIPAFSLGLIFVIWVCLTATRSQFFHRICRGGREGRVPCHVPPSDISKGPGSRLQRGCSGDNAGPKRQKPLHAASLFDSQQASPQCNCSVWSRWREAGCT